MTSPASTQQDSKQSIQKASVFYLFTKIESIFLSGFSYEEFWLLIFFFFLFSFYKFEEEYGDAKFYFLRKIKENWRNIYSPLIRVVSPTTSPFIHQTQWPWKERGNACEYEQQHTTIPLRMTIWASQYFW